MSPSPLFKPGRELPVLWENPHYAVIAKPSGLPSHPGPRAPDSVEARLVAQKRGGPWLAHRLDTDTAGCLLIAKRKTALIAAQEAFAQRQTRKIYWALVRGAPGTRQGETPGNVAEGTTEGVIDTPLKRLSTPEGWRIVVARPGDEDAQTASTRWRLLGQSGEGDKRLSWLELELLTGRTHQARVHCAQLGTPILNDPLYGTASPDDARAGPMQLLARALRVPCGETVIEAEAQPEEEMARLLSAMKTP